VVSTEKTKAVGWGNRFPKVQESKHEGHDALFNENTKGIRYDKWQRQKETQNVDLEDSDRGDVLARGKLTHVFLMRGKGTKLFDNRQRPAH